MNRRIPVVVIALLVLNVVLRLGDFSGRAPGGFTVLVLPVPELFVLGKAFYRAIFREAFSPLEELRFLPAFLEMIPGRAALNSTVGAIAAIAVIAVVPAANIPRGTPCRSTTRCRWWWTT